MAPPAGTSSMLRYRRRDATLKPNRTLDRSASRGMLYENEELRLRTININAEVEKGQNYIKKLRRENEQLKKEIWNLREEYERLENYVKSREQSENEEEDENELVTAIADEVPEVMAETMVAPVTVASLETVVEEEDDQQEQPVGEKIDESRIEPPNAPPGGDVEIDDNNGGGGENDCSVDDDGGADSDEPQGTKGLQTVTADAVAVDVVCGGRDDGGYQRQRLDRDRGDDAFLSPQRDPLLPLPQQLQLPPGQPHPDTVQPHTACFDTGNNGRLHDLTVDEVIDAIQDVELRDKLRTVCLTDDRCYMTFANGECLERALHATYRIRDVSVLLMDTGSGATMLSLTGVPDTVVDKDVLKCLKKYGTIIGGVERKTARGGTAGGERYVRVRLTLGAPRYLWFGSDKVIVRQLTEHETGSMNSIARRKSFRSQIKLNLKMADPSPSSATVTGSADDAKENGSGAGTGFPAKQMTTVSLQNGFRFPADAKTAAASDNSKATAAAKSVATGSPKRSKTSSDGGNGSGGGCPPTASAESPLRGRRRPSLMGFRRDTITKHRGGSVSRAEGEDADSDTSTICRRKLSITGRENTEKVPWCGCWGNGCL